MKNRVFNLLWGLSLLVMGVVLLGNSLGLWFVDIFSYDWWILFIVFPSLICICLNQNKWFNLILFIASILIMIVYRNIWSFEVLVEIVLCAIVIITGSMLTSFAFKHERSSDEDDKSNTLIVNGFCGLFKKKLSNRNLEVVKINIIFGKLNLDIDSSLIKKDLRIKVLSIFGMLRIVNASMINVEVECSNIGSIIKNEVGVHKSKLPTVYVEGISIFSLLKIKK